MLKNSSLNGNFYLSGAIAIGLYLIVFLSFLFYLSTNEAKTYNALKKVTVLELDIVIDEKKELSNKPLRVEQKKNKVEEVVKKSTSKSTKQASNLKSLFANVKTTEPKLTKKVVNNVKAAKTISRYKAKFEKEKKVVSTSNVSNLLKSVKASKKRLTISTNSKEANDPYYSKIHELLATRWNPSLVKDGLEAKILVVIYNDGEFDYKFLRYSHNEQFDNMLKAFLENQKSIKYPSHDKGYKTDIEVTFKSKG